MDNKQAKLTIEVQYTVNPENYPENISYDEMVNLDITNLSDPQNMKYLLEMVEEGGVITFGKILD